MMNRWEVDKKLRSCTWRVSWWRTRRRRKRTTWSMRSTLTIYILNIFHIMSYISYHTYIIYNSQNRLTRSTSKKPTSAQIGPSRRMTLRADWIFADLVITIITIFVLVNMTSITILIIMALSVISMMMVLTGMHRIVGLRLWEGGQLVARHWRGEAPLSSVTSPNHHQID